MRVIKEADVRKQEILNAAIQVFAKKNYDKTSISDIARECGISQGLCYRYFASKEEIYDAAVEQYASYIAEGHIKGYIYGNLTIKEQISILSGSLTRYKNVEKEATKLYEMFHKEENQKLHNQIFGKVCEKLIPFITSILEKAKERGEIFIKDANTTAYFMVYGQAAMLARVDLGEAEKKEKIEECLLQLLGIKNNK